MTRHLTVVMSVRPNHASRIYALVKPFEFRRRPSRLHPLDKILIYETRPVGTITGEATIEAVIIGAADELCLLEPDIEERVHVRAYLNGTTRAVAFQLAEITRYENPIALDDIGIRRAPQSYQFVGH